MNSRAFGDKKKTISTRKKHSEARLSGKPYVTQKSKLQKPEKAIPKNEVSTKFLTHISTNKCFMILQQEI